MDTPGILWPKFEDQQVGIRLACVGSIKDDILNMEELALWLIDYLRENYKGILAERYQITEEGGSSGGDCQSQRVSEKAGRAGLCQSFADTV